MAARHLTADDLVAEARRKIAPRLTPQQALSAMRSGDITLIDIRPYEQQKRDGQIPGAVLVNTNVVEYRCDPSQPDSYRDPAVRPDDYELKLVILCNQGYKSSLQA